MATGTEADIDDIGVFSPQMTPHRPARSRARSATSSPDIKDVTRRARRRHADHRVRRQPGSQATEALPGYRERQADGLLRALPDRRRRLRGPARRAREAQLNDAALSWRARDLATRSASASAAASWACCTWRSCSERLEREYDLDLIATTPSRAVTRPDADRRRGARGRTTPPTCPTRARSRRSASRSSRRIRDRPERVHGRRDGAVPGTTRRSSRAAVPPPGARAC